MRRLPPPVMVRWLTLTLAGLVGGGCPGPEPTPADASGSETSTTTVDPGTTTTVGGLDTTAGTVGATGSTGSGTSDGTTTGGPGSSSEAGTSSGTGGTASTSSGGTSSGGESSGSESSSGGDPVCPPGGGLPCVDPSECASNACWVVGPLGGVCSECDEDADCAMGCSAGNPLLGACAFCCDGSLGCGCESDAACQAGLTCELVFAVPGILGVSGCSECGTDGDCAAGQLCTPTTDLNAFDGHYACLPPGAKAIDEMCDDAGSGDAQCASGQCAPAALMGIPVIDVCSECDADADCPGGTCVLPEIVINGNLLEVASGQCV